MSQQWAGRKVTAARTMVAAWLPMQCGRCPRIVDGSEPWVVGHKLSRATRPDLMWDPGNWQPEHRSCSDKSAQAAVIEKARAEGARDALSGVFPASDAPNSPRTFPSLSSGPQGASWDLDATLLWPHHVENAPEWLRPYLAVPGDASPPLAMTPVHPDAVGSYGPEAVEWIESRRQITLRWWQRLAIVRQLEHDEQGRLCWPVVVESAPRRAGKSERLRSLALWRLEHGGALFEPDQIVIHLGRALDIVREVQQRAWSWCEAQGWEVTRGNGKEAVTHPDGGRWLAKAMHASYGFDCHLGLADECWDVEPGAISEGIEPAMLDRESAQLVLTSTSHRRATSLMKRRIAPALTGSDGRTLLLLWGITPDADIFDEEVWRAASPYWTEERRSMIAAKLLEAQEGSPELDDPDPVGSWAHQYLNRWDLVVRRTQRGEPVVTEERWRDLVDEVPFAEPDAAAIESWFEAGASTALAWRLEGGRVLVSVTEHDDLASAVAAVRGSGCRRPPRVGASLVGDPAVKGLRAKRGEGRTGASVAELRRLLGEGAFSHDGGVHLTAQVLEVRTVPSADGPRLSSKGRADAIKAAVWAIGDARRAQSGKPRVVLAGS